MLRIVTLKPLVFRSEKMEDQQRPEPRTIKWSLDKNHGKMSREAEGEKKTEA